MEKRESKHLHFRTPLLTPVFVDYLLNLTFFKIYRRIDKDV